MRRSTAAGSTASPQGTFEGVDPHSERLADGGEALAELAVDDDEQVLARRQHVDEAGLHHAGPRAGHEQHAVLRAEHGPQHGLALDENGAELGPAMRQHRLRNRLAHALGHRGGPGKTQAVGLGGQIGKGRDFGCVAHGMCARQRRLLPETGSSGCPFCMQGCGASSTLLRRFHVAGLVHAYFAFRAAPA